VGGKGREDGIGGEGRTGEDRPKREGLLPLEWRSGYAPGIIIPHVSLPCQRICPAMVTRPARRRLSTRRTSSLRLESVARCRLEAERGTLGYVAVSQRVFSLTVHGSLLVVNV